MRIFYDKHQGVGLLFEAQEVDAALTVLEFIYGGTRLEYVLNAIHKIREVFKLAPPPTKLQMVVHNHLCEKCCRMINTKVDKFIYRTADGNSSYIHQECPPRKE